MLSDSGYVLDTFIWVALRASSSWISVGGGVVWRGMGNLWQKSYIDVHEATQSGHIDEVRRERAWPHAAVLDDNIVRMDHMEQIVRGPSLLYTDITVVASASSLVS